ncbi:unnamed protein product [Prorocentrum cordatum]|uniref:Protein ZIP4 homolog n=1 Tax=Prorocentrum cordatum TaxID=2364126 RepID=A0ABN9XMM6_9DINO|nr:unnamed protein product [Polarella glacialis]
MTIARHAAASVDDGLWACGLLRGAGHPAARVLACLKELRARVRSADAESQRKLLLYRLEFASAVVESGSSSPGLPSGDDAWVLLQEVVLELREVAQRAEQAWLELFQEVVALLWSKSSAAFEAGDHAKAAQWLTQAVPFIQEPGQVANCLATIALYHKRAGNKEDTRDYVQRALATDPANLQATLLVVVDSADHAVEAAHIQGLLERLMANPSFAPKHAACVASALLQQPQADLALAGLEVLLRKLLQAPAEAANLEQTAGADVLDGLSISCEVLERSAALKRPAADFVRHVGLSADHLLAHRAEVIQAFREGSGPRVDEVRRLLRAAWERGKELGASEHWEECAAVLEALQGLLEQLDALDSREVLEVRIWGLVMAASAKLSLARGAARGPKARSETHQQALHCLDRAHQLCRRASSAAGAIAGQAAASALLGASTLGRAFCVLVLLEFEVRCLSGDSESQLQRFVDDASSQEAVGIKALLFMAKIAAAASMRKLAMHCLQRYLRVAVNASGGLDAPQCAVAYRELIGLHASRQESFVVYDGILNLLSGVGGMSGVIDGAVVKYPKDELEWLAATAWNNGAYFYRLQQYRWAERWMSKSMALLKFIPGSFPEDDMVKSYTDCVEHCRD